MLDFPVLYCDVTYFFASLCIKQSCCLGAGVSFKFLVEIQENPRNIVVISVVFDSLKEFVNFVG